MEKMVIVSTKEINYKPCLDGRDVKSSTQLMEEIAVASARNAVEAVTGLAKELLNLEERNTKAQRNEEFIREISQYIVGNISSGEVICEGETVNDIYQAYRRSGRIHDRHDDDTSLFILTRAALYRLVESGVLKKTRAKVRKSSESDWNARDRVVYIAL